MYVFLLLPLCDFRGVYEHEIVNNVLTAYEIIFYNKNIKFLGKFQ